MKRIKTGGRKEGTPNKITSILKETLSEYSLNELEFIMANKERLSIEARCNLLAKVLPYVLPKCEGNAITSEVVTPIHIVFSKE